MRRVKSFDELQQLVKKQEEENRKETEYLNKKLALVGSIYEKISNLEKSNTGILEKEFKYNGNSSIIRGFSEKEKFQPKQFISGIKAYANSCHPELVELSRMNQVLDSLVKRSDKIDLMTKERERQRREEEKQEEEKQEALSSELQAKRAENRPLMNALNKRKILELYHFTRIENLKSIVEMGIWPREEIKKSNISYICNDEVRAEGMEECSCVSIEFPNKWLLQSYMERTLDSDWVLIKLDAKLLLNQKNYYAEYNAATYSVKEDLRTKTSVESFEKMFVEIVSVQKSNGYQMQYERKNLVSYLPTSDQAEILVEGIISPCYIKAIIFRNEDVKKRYEEYLKSKKIECSVNADWFKYNREHFTWEER